MTGIWQLIPVLLGMVLVTFIAGYVPNIGISKRNLNLIAVYGGGVLMGAAILIVLPESLKVMVENNYVETKPKDVDEIFPESLV